MLTIFASVDIISGEISSHTIQSIVTKPLERWQVIVGKWLGLVIMLVLYLGLLCLGLILATNLIVGYLPANLPEGIGVMMLEVPVLLSLSLLGGALLSTLTNGIVLFMFYGLAFIGFWVEQVGAALQVDGAIRVGVITSLLMPVEALWRRSAFLMQPPVLADLPATPFTSSSTPSPAMIWYALLYALLVLGLAVQVFSRRDL
jgi:Cu-processing system permease protein